MRKLLLLLWTGILPLILSAQTFGIGTDSPDANAILDVVSTSKGIFVPRMTTVQRDASLGALTNAQEGLLIYNNTDSEFNYWDGGTWIAFPGGGADADWDNTGSILSPTDGDAEDVTIGTSFSNGKLSLTSTDEISLYIRNSWDNSFSMGVRNNMLSLTNGGYGIYQSFTGSTSGSGPLYGQFNDFSTVNSSGAEAIYGTSNDMATAGSSNTIGVDNIMDGTSTGDRTGVQNTISGTGSGDHIGSLNLISSTGTGEKIGVENRITSTANRIYGSKNSFLGNPGLQITGTNNEFNNTGSASLYGVFNDFGSNGTGPQIGIYNSMNNSGTSLKYGLQNVLVGNNAGGMTGVNNSLSGTSTSGEVRGVDNSITVTTNFAVRGSYNIMNVTNSALVHGIINQISGTAADNGNIYGTYNGISIGGANVRRYGVYNVMNLTQTGARYGTFNLIQGNNTSGNHYGNWIQLSATSAVNKYGSFYSISNAVGGTDYGIFLSASGVNNYGIYSSQVSNPGYAGYFQGNLAYTGSFTFASDKQFKEAIKPMESGLNKILQLQPYYYNYKSDLAEIWGFPRDRQAGFIAQQVESVLPNVVVDQKHHAAKAGFNPEEDEEVWTNYKAIEPIELLPYLVKAIQELHEIVEEKDEMIENLDARVKVLENK